MLCLAVIATKASNAADQQGVCDQAHHPVGSPPPYPVSCIRRRRPDAISFTLVAPA